MVNQNTISADDSASVSDDNGMNPLIIEDSTSPEQLEKEAAWERGENIDDNTENIDGGVGAVETEDRGVDEGETPEPEPVVQPLANETPQIEESIEDRVSRLVSEQTKGLQSSYDKRVAEAEKKARLAEEENRKFNLDTAVETSLRRQEQQLAEGMGEDAARDYVRSEENVANVRQSHEQAEQNRVLQQQATYAGLQNRSNTMAQWVDKLANDHSLQQEDVEVITGMVTRESLVSEEGFIQMGEAMEKVARRLGSNAPAKVKRRVPRETPGQAPSDGRSTTASPTSDDALTDSANSKPSWQWTDEEKAAMRRMAFGG
tara:strand:- start:12590 stop:13540 length:951 start_codon:yes stop_codon:yes gene_type:complete